MKNCPLSETVSSAQSGPQPGDEHADPVSGLVFCWVPPGQFLMGSTRRDPDAYPDERPAHDVQIQRGFWLGKYPVTIADYLRFCREADRNWPEWHERGSRYHIVEGRHEHYRSHVSAAPDDPRPVVGVFWQDTQAYCTWLNKLAGRDACRLPSEAEWEYACRAGTTEPRYGHLDEIAWYNGNSGLTTHPVGQKAPNAWGLRDMLGNVLEWVADEWRPTSREIQSRVPRQCGPVEADHVFRGGSWRYGAVFCRAAYRDKAAPEYRNFNLGFRVVLDGPPTQCG